MKPVRRKLCYNANASSRKKILDVFQYNVKRDVDFLVWFEVSMIISQANTPLWTRFKNETQAQ